jgi:hypothetical protein
MKLGDWKEIEEIFREALRALEGGPTKGPGNQHLPRLALFLPFRCNERRQTATSQCKA